LIPAQTHLASTLDAKDDEHTREKMPKTLSVPEVLEEQARWAALEQLAAEELDCQRELEQLAIAFAAIIEDGHRIAELDREGTGRTERPDTPAGSTEDRREEETSNSSS
jgi:hypothetical protein